MIYKISHSLTKATVIAVQRALKREARKKGRRKANILAAVREAGGTNADRTLIRDLALNWNGDRRLQYDVFFRVLQILGRLDPPKAKKLRLEFWSQDCRRELREVIRSADWAEIASPLELSFLDRDPDAEIPTGYPVSVRQLPAIRKNPDVAKALDDFKAWAAKHDHNKWVVQSCLQRALGPLVSQIRTRGLMPGWEDLENNQLLFIALSLERERMMLGTQPLRIRAIERFTSPSLARMMTRSLDTAMAPRLLALRRRNVPP